LLLKEGKTRFSEDKGYLYTLKIWFFYRSRKVFSTFLFDKKPSRRDVHCSVRSRNRCAAAAGAGFASETLIFEFLLVQEAGSGI